MNKSSISSLIFCLVFSFSVKSQEVQIVGIVAIPETGVSYPEWSMIRYPRELIINAQEKSKRVAISFKDQFGFKCDNVEGLYNVYSHSYVFNNCLDSKDETSLPLTYVLTIRSGKVNGVAVMNKILLRLSN